MGADLMGYWAFAPLVGSNDIVKAQIKQIKKVLLGDKGITEIMEGKSEGWAEAAIAQLEKIGIEDPDGSDGPDFLQRVVTMLEDAEKFDVKDFSPRDGSFAEITVNSVKVRVLFAGEMSWGDEPSGYGYGILKALSELGIEQKLHDAIPWGNKVKGKKP